jgi:hypothetical protein
VESLVVPNFGLRAVVDTLRCRCRFGMKEATGGDGGSAGVDWVVDAHGCPAVLPPGDVAAHEATCGFELVTCGNASRGGAQRCDAQTLRRDAAAHASTCPLRLRPCYQRCGAQMAGCDMWPHTQQDCPRAIVHCDFFGCYARMQRCDQPLHDAERMADHLAGERQARLAYRDGVICAAAAAGGITVEISTQAAAALTMLLERDASAQEVQAALLALAPLLASVPASDKLPNGAMAPVAAAMRAHGAHAGVQAAALSCLRFAAPHTRPGDAAAAAAAGALLAAMDTHGNALVLLHACSALAAETEPETFRCLQGGSLFTPSLAAGACNEQLLSVLEFQAPHARLQALGLRALSRALTHPDGATAPSAVDLTVRHMSAAKVARDALQRHPLDAGVAQHACSTLRAATTVAAGGEAARAVAVAAAAPGVVFALLDALAAHRAHAPLLLDAAAALQALFTHPPCAAGAASYRVPLAAAAGGGAGGNGIALLLRLLREQGGARADVAQACLAALAELAAHTCVAAAFSFDADAHAIIAALHAHTADASRHRRFPLTPMHAAAALARLVRAVAASRVSGSTAERAIGALTEASRLMPAASSSPPFHVSLFSFITHLSTNAQHRSRIVAHGALGAVADAMLRLPADAHVQRSGCEALAALCAQSQPRHAACARADGARDAVAAAAAAFPPGFADGVAAASATALALINFVPAEPPSGAGGGACD